MNGSDKPTWAFAGCRGLGLAVLQAALAEGCAPSLVATLPNPGPYEEEILRLSQARKIPSFLSGRGVELCEPLKSVGVLLVARFSLLPPEVFRAPALGAVNLHPSLLPQYRGVHPIPWAMIRGEKETGVTLHHIDEGIDTGPIILQRSLPIEPEESLPSLESRVNSLAAQVGVEFLVQYLRDGQVPAGMTQASPGPLFYARRRGPEDSRVHWTMTRRELRDLVRTLQPPLPAAYGVGARGHLRIRSCVPLEGKGHAPPGTVVEALGPEAYLVAVGDGLCALTVDGSLQVGEVLA